MIDVNFSAFWRPRGTSPRPIPLVVTGGIVLFDEYALPEWPGESKAVDEYFKGCPPRMEKVGWASWPGAWFVKSEAAPQLT